MLINAIFIIIFSYLIGSFPTAFIISKLFKIGDIRNQGSGNIGATNVLRVGNKKIAFLVLLIDVMKGYLTLIILQNYLLLIDLEIYIYIFGSFVIFGHIFPIWLKFKGGKGVATYIGYLLAFNAPLFFLFIIIWLFIAIFKRYSSLASIISLISLPLFMIIFSYKINHIYLISIISIIIILMHYSNILRLFNKTESKIKL